MSSDPLLEAIEAASTEYIGKPGDCKVCHHLDQMEEPRRKAVEAALAGTMGAARLAEILTANGYPIGKTSIVKHRKGHKP